MSDGYVRIQSEVMIMKTKAIFSMIALMALVTSLAVPSLVSATEVTIDAGETHTKTYDLDDFGWVSWSWTVEGFDSVDFWVEDSNGQRYDEEYDETWDAGLYYADSDGKYYLKWRNDGVTPITVDYTLSSFGSNPIVEDAANAMLWTGIIIAVIIIVIIVVVVVAVVMSGKKKPDAQQQQQQQYDQQQYYQQQQQYQQPYQQQPQQQYPQQPYPQQPQDPQQPQPPQQQYQQPPQQQYQQPYQQQPQQQYPQQPPQQEYQPPAKKQQYPPQE
jgi:type II secretory pathway pseudopilin PulG